MARPKARCGAPVMSSTTKSDHDNCRKYVKEEGLRCHVHRKAPPKSVTITVIDGDERIEVKVSTVDPWPWSVDPTIFHYLAKANVNMIAMLNDREADDDGNE